MWRFCLTPIHRKNVKIPQPSLGPGDTIREAGVDTGQSPVFPRPRLVPLTPISAPDAVGVVPQDGREPSLLGQLGSPGSLLHTVGTSKRNVPRPVDESRDMSHCGSYSSKLCPVTFHLSVAAVSHARAGLKYSSIALSGCNAWGSNRPAGLFAGLPASCMIESFPHVGDRCAGQPFLRPHPLPPMALVPDREESPI